MLVKLLSVGRFIHLWVRLCFQPGLILNSFLARYAHALLRRCAVKFLGTMVGLATKLPLRSTTGTRKKTGWRHPKVKSSSSVCNRPWTFWSSFPSRTKKAKVKDDELLANENSKEATSRHWTSGFTGSLKFCGVRARSRILDKSTSCSYFIRIRCQAEIACHSSKIKSCSSLTANCQRPHPWLDSKFSFFSSSALDVRAR